MAWRLHTSIIRGEIDNRRKGRVTGQLWLEGRPDPVTLDLKGNALKDLAGCFITFTNPAPAREDSVNLNPVQKGVVGDITGSRKVRIPDVPIEEMMALIKQGKKVPEHMGNCLYIEWFSEPNGRVVVESADFTLTVSAPAWQMTDEQEQEQLQANREAILEFLDRIAGASDEDDDYDPEEDKPMDEFQWEKLLKESDQRSEKFGKLLEKYEGHPDQEKLVAREMGWTWLEEAIEADDRGKLDKKQDDAEDSLEDLPDLEPNPLTEGVDWVRDEHGHPQHPLVLRAMKLSTGMWRKCEKKGLLGETADKNLFDMIFQTQMTGAKLAGALNSLCYDHNFEGGMIVAWLKRALNFLHKAIGFSDKVVPKNLVPPDELTVYRKELFAIREEILALMERFREQV